MLADANESRAQIPKQNESDVKNLLLQRGNRRGRESSHNLASANGMLRPRPLPALGQVGCIKQGPASSLTEVCYPPVISFPR